jgi:excisionase family DNA binding protein
MPEYLSAEAVAAQLKISKPAVYRLVHRGTLGKVYIGVRVFFKQEHLDAYLANPLYQKRSRAATSEAQRAAKKAAKS